MDFMTGLKRTDYCGNFRASDIGNNTVTARQLLVFCNDGDGFHKMRKNCAVFLGYLMKRRNMRFGND